jgi:ribosomal protein S18 acetylase RimI-like enzyme
MPAIYLGALDPTKHVDALRLRLAGEERDITFLVVEGDGPVVGFSIFGPPRFAASNLTTELWAMNVSPDAWGAGAGTALLHETLRMIRKRGTSEVMLWCIAGNQRARKLYERHGFVATGESRTTAALTGHPLNEAAYALQL